MFPLLPDCASRNANDGATASPMIFLRVETQNNVFFSFHVLKLFAFCLRLEVSVDDSRGSFRSFALLAHFVSPMTSGLLDGMNVGRKVIPSLIVLSLLHKFFTLLFPGNLFHVEYHLMTSGHMHFVLHRLGMLEIFRVKSGDGMFEVFPMFGLVSVRNLRQSRRTHEHVGIEDDDEKRKTAQTNLIVKFVEIPSFRIFGNFDDHLTAVAAAARSVTNERTPQSLAPTRGNGRRPTPEAAPHHESTQGTQHSHRPKTRTAETHSTRFAFS